MLPVRPAVAIAAATALLAGFPVGASLAGLTPLSTPARAAEPLAFTIPSEDGYGIAECMQAGSACGEAMATSWCQAHGHLRAVAYGEGRDVTGTVVNDTAQPIADGDVLIRCGD